MAAKWYNYLTYSQSSFSLSLATQSPIQAGGVPFTSAKSFLPYVIEWSLFAAIE
jgi:hypothetical protein